MHRKPVPVEEPVVEIGTKTNPGPWGDLYYVPFTISAPEEVLPVRTLEATGTHWFFRNYSLVDLEKLFSADDISAGIRQAVMDPTVWHRRDDGIDLTPPASVVMGLQETARKRIYQTLAQFPENHAEINFIHKGTLQDRFGDGSVSEDTVRMFRQLSCEHGDYLVFSGLATMLAKLPSYEEKVGFLKALTRQKTLLLRIHMKPDTDVAALDKYWGKGGRATDARTLFESLARVPGGSWVNVLTVIPPVPSSRLYTYPTEMDNPLNGPLHIRDCHWTTFNFFRGSQERDVDPQSVLNELKSSYAPAAGDPRYGDVLLFAKPDGEVIHSCIYLADDIVFTKNGATNISPWMLSTIQDLKMRYTFEVPEGQKLVLNYYRHKDM